MAAGWPTWLVPVLAVGRALTTHHRPHNCPYKSAALGLFQRWRPAQVDPGCDRSAAPGQAGQMAGVGPARILLVQDRFPGGAGQPRRAVARGCWRWRSLS